MMTRDTAHTAPRVVVKVGSSSISGDREHQMLGLVDALAAWQQAGSEVILVSSGAIAVGAPFLKLSDRHKTWRPSKPLRPWGKTF